MTDPAISEYCLLWATWACMTRTEWAAWVQALGSIAAIGGAFWLARWQDHRAQRHAMLVKDADDRRLLELAVEAVRDTEDAAFEIGKFRSTEGWTEPAGQRVDFSDRLYGCVSRIRALQIDSLRTSSARRTFRSAASWAETALQLVSDLAPAGGADFFVPCGKTYGQPWLPVHTRLRDCRRLLEWEIQRIDDPRLPEPNW